MTGTTTNTRTKVVVGVVAEPDAVHVSVADSGIGIRAEEIPGLFQPFHQIDTGLDPVCAIAVTLVLAPHSKARLSFATAASLSSPTLQAVVDKYRQGANVHRASLMSATLTSIRLRALRISPESFTAMQTLTSMLVHSLTRVQARRVRPENSSNAVCDRRLLWRLGISGDRPVILVLAGMPQGMGLLRALAQALSLWSWSRLACDLVVVNTELDSYLMPLQHELAPHVHEEEDEEKLDEVTAFAWRLRHLGAWRGSTGRRVRVRRTGLVD